MITSLPFIEKKTISILIFHKPSLGKKINELHAINTLTASLFAEDKSGDDAAEC